MTIISSPPPTLNLSCQPVKSQEGSAVEPSGGGVDWRQAATKAGSMSQNGCRLSLNGCFQPRWTPIWINVNILTGFVFLERQ
jgi:hypothetical protein